MGGERVVEAQEFAEEGSREGPSRVLKNGSTGWVS
jgi:hypothetical protein